ncbi:protein of unknown function [Legionella longbeachae NSW150]|uniref:Uncharacterized protein n=1 Tax=Legionella longbeachae serogroup 1 (strain NSW150) TaxID=661367 RepID=D3HK47_LEGLN|nr:protein of unknown function [Legionella longbeachae NSW150]
MLRSSNTNRERSYCVLSGTPNLVNLLTTLSLIANLVSETIGFIHHIPTIHTSVLDGLIIFLMI